LQQHACQRFTPAAAPVRVRIAEHNQHARLNFWGISTNFMNMAL